jgi:LysR family transcriptional activator of nhaA
MSWLNHHHLLYFWTVAREGSIARASGVLNLTPQTISAQIKSLEETLGEKLFDRVGRGLVLTETGKTVRGYADEIFGLSQELVDVVQGKHTGRSSTLRVGMSDALPKLICHRLLMPALEMPERVHLVCREEGVQALLAQLAVHRLDLVLNDAPIPANVSVRAYNHLLGECGVVWLASRALAKKAKGRFPQCLSELPVLLPTDDTALRRSLDLWFTRYRIRPNVVAEMHDTALTKTFGEAGAGIFPIASLMRADVEKKYGVVLVGEADGVAERFYGISVERRVRHPGVAAILEAARNVIFESNN